MKTTNLMAVLVVMSLAVPGVSAAQAQGDKPVASNRVTKTAEVVDVDKKNRIVTLKQANGEQTDVKVGERVKNFDQIKKGDQVTVQLYESVGLNVRKAQGQQPSVTVGPEVVQVAPPGDKPAGVVANTKIITARVEAIDYKDRLVTLRGPQGNVVTIRAGDDVKNLEQIKKGDQVEAMYTQAVAVVVQKPKS